MYDYKKRSNAERRMMVELRAQREFPLHEPPRSIAHGLFLITSACYQHKNVFANRTDLHWLCYNFLQTAQASDFLPIAWVFLPNHNHLLVSIPNMTEFSEFIRKIHSRVSTHMNLLEKKLRRRIWYSFSDRRIKSNRHKEATIHYIHQNPVKHGWARSSEHWAWSSVHEYIDRFGLETMCAVANKYDLSKYGEGWDR